MPWTIQTITWSHCARQNQVDVLKHYAVETAIATSRATARSLAKQSIKPRDSRRARAVAIVRSPLGRPTIFGTKTNIRTLFRITLGLVNDLAEHYWR